MSVGPVMPKQNHPKGSGPTKRQVGYFILSAGALMVGMNVSNDIIRTSRTSLPQTPSPQDKSINRMLLKGLHELKPKLPMKIGEFTTGVDARVNGNEFIYVYSVSPQIDPDLATTEEQVRSNYCNQFKSQIDRGVVLTNEYWTDEPHKRYIGKITITSCPPIA